MFHKPFDIYSVQSRNRTKTALITVLFVLLIVGFGVAFDLLFDIPYAWRIIMLPFVILAAISGLRSFRDQALTRLWNHQWVEDDASDELFALSFRILIGSALIIILMPLIFDPELADRIVRQYIDIPNFEHIPIGTILAGIVGLACATTSLRWGAASILWSMRATVMTDLSDRYTELANIVEEMSLAAGIPKPQIYLVNDRDPNAFAIGGEPGDSAIVVTSGLLSVLSRDELQGVIAHEMSHIRNEDTRLMTSVTVLFGAVLLLSQWLRSATFSGGLFGMRVPGVGFVLRAIFFLLWLLSLVFAPFVAKIVAMTVSREREYLADASAAELTRNPKALATALVKLEKSSDPTISFSPGVAQLCIVDPLERRIDSKEGFLADLFATHPPMKKRLILLNAMAYEK